VPQVFAIQALRVKKCCSRFFKGDPVLELISLSLFRVPIEHQLCIYTIKANRKEKVAVLAGKARMNYEK
jgi:hypothetical protein